MASSVPDVVGISELLVDLPAEHLHEEVVQHLQKAVRSFDTSVDRYVRNKLHVRKRKRIC